MATSLTRGQLVATRREAAGFSQEELARRLRCSIRTVVRIERDENRVMHQRIRDALHKTLGIPLRELANLQGRGA